MEAIAVSDVVSLALYIKGVCDAAGHTRSLLAVVARHMDSLVPVVRALEAEEGGGAIPVVGGRGFLHELQKQMRRILELARKARNTNRVVFILKASEIRQKLEVALRAVQLSLATLQMIQNQTLRAELRGFEDAWRWRQAELREEADRERRERRRLVERPSRGASGAADLEAALRELRFERDREREAARRAADSVARDKRAAEAALMQQIIAALEEAATATATTATAATATTVAERDMPDACYCPVTGEVMYKPVTVDAICFHTCGQPAFARWLELGGVTCPVCGSELRSLYAAPNVSTRELVEEFLAARAAARTAAAMPAAAPAAAPHSHGASAPAPTAAPAPAPASTPSVPRKKQFVDGGFRGDYEGDLDESGRRHGRGIMKWDNGHVYNGEWKENKMEGRGTFRFASGNVYEGEFKDGKFEGRGTYRFADGNVYEGEYKDNKIEGQGTYRFADGAVYDGEWKDGKREGRGTYRFASGEVYEGEFKDNKREGRGTYRYADGAVYEGEFKDGKREGRGTFRFADGRAEVSRYKSDAGVGEGALWSADGGTAHRLLDGAVVGKISLREAEEIAGRIGLPVPARAADFLRGRTNG